MLTDSPTQLPPEQPTTPFRWRSFITGRRRVWTLALIGALLIGGTIARIEFPPRKPPVAVAGRFPQSTAAMRTAGHLRVLFLGNSLTEYNGGLAMVMQQLARSAGKAPMPIFDEVTKFGATWAQLWDVTQAPAMIRQGHWDYVVLQDYSTAPLVYRSEMEVYGRRFSQEIKAIGARPVFFMTWAHDDQLQFQQRIAGAYISVALANHGLLAPVGYAWLRVLKENPEIVIYDPRDNPKKHPTPAGSYLTACVFYSMLFHQSPHGLTGRIVDGTTVYVDLPPMVANYLQDTAWESVKAMGPLASTRPATMPVATAPTP
jgi:hypothetical protein